MPNAMLLVLQRLIAQDKIIEKLLRLFNLVDFVYVQFVGAVGVACS